MNHMAKLEIAAGNHEEAYRWFTLVAKTGCVHGMHSVGVCLEEGQGVARDDQAAVNWYRLAAQGGNARSAINLSIMYTDGRGVTRSKQQSLQNLRRAADLGNLESCHTFATQMYLDMPYARKIGHILPSSVSQSLYDTTSILATSLINSQRYEVPKDVLISVMVWMHRAKLKPIIAHLHMLRDTACDGGRYCNNPTCIKLGKLQDFKACPLCKTARYCGSECQTIDWNEGRHKFICRTVEQERIIGGRASLPPADTLVREAETRD
jgi:hypothetical protein